MTTPFERLWAKCLPVIAMTGLVALIIFGIIFAFYFLIIVALLGFFVFLFSYLRVKLSMKKAHAIRAQQFKSVKNNSKGRTVDHDNL